jgi:hypothetical protein
MLSTFIWSPGTWARIGYITYGAVATGLFAYGFTTLGARRQRALTEKSLLQMRRAELQQEALLRLLDGLSRVRVALETVLAPETDDSGRPRELISYSAASGDVAALGLGEYVMEMPGAGTWDLTGPWEKMNAQWVRVVEPTLHLERRWRSSLADRIEIPELHDLWKRISHGGMWLALEAGANPRPTAEQMRRDVAALMAEIQKHA